MSILVTTTVPLDITVYDQISPHTTPALLAAPGFRSHAAHTDHEGTFTVTEIWDTREDHRAFFDANVAANLPPGVTSTVIDLRNAVTA